MYTPIPIMRSTRYGNNYWEAFSVKMNRDVRFFSDLEYDHWILVEADPDIIAFCEQPKRIQVEWQGELVESIFDMWLQRRNGQEYFLEVKYASELDPSNKRFSTRSYRQTKAQAKWCQENGFNHLVQTDKDIRSNLIYLNNLKTIIPYIQQHPVLIETVKYQIMKILGKASKTTIERIEQELPDLGRQRIRETIYQLIYHGMINSTIAHKPLDSKTEVWHNAQEKMD